MNLIKAVEADNVNAVCNAINEGYNVNVACIGKLPPLSVAAVSNCKIDIVKKLIQAGALLDDALLLACTNGNFEIFKELVNAGGFVDAVNESSVPLLHIACHCGAEFVKLLLINGANPNISCGQGKTALHAAVEQQCEPEVFKLLMRYKADPATKNQCGLTAEEVALTKGYYMTQRLIMSIRKSNPIPKQGKRKKFESDILDTLNALHSAEKKLKTCQKTCITLRKKIVTAENELSKNHEICVQMRRKLVVHVDEKDTLKIESASRTLLECPVCFADFTPKMKVFQCPEGHLLCENCKNWHGMVKCPQCFCSISNLNIRNRALEEMISDAFDKSK